MATKLSFLFQFATDPQAGANNRVHTAGWSESFWARNPKVSSDPEILALATKRARCLPKSASIIGIRIANYDIVGNKLKPTGSSSGKLLRSGNAGFDCDIPQMSVSVGISSADGPNLTKITLRGIPDTQVIGGEFSPTPAFKRNVEDYLDELIAKNWKFIGRDLSLPVANIISVAGNVVTLTGPIGAVANTSYVRFLHAKADGGDPISGAYLATAVAGNTITLAGYSGGNMGTPSGKMRVDAIKVLSISDYSGSRVAVRKVGRPFENYRGRASKRR